MLKIERNTPDEARHMNNLVLALVLTTQLDSIYSHKVTISLETNFGIIADWHDVAASLDELATKGNITRVSINGNGNVVYEVTK